MTGFDGSDVSLSGMAGATPLTVTGISVSDLLVSNADVGGTFTATINYSKAMEPRDAPQVTLPDVSTTMTRDGSWLGSDIYETTFLIAGANTAVGGVDVVVPYTLGLSGQLTDVAEQADVSDIDTADPTPSIIVVPTDGYLPVDSVIDFE